MRVGLDSGQGPVVGRGPNGVGLGAEAKPWLATGGQRRHSGCRPGEFARRRESRRWLLGHASGNDVVERGWDGRVESGGFRRVEREMAADLLFGAVTGIGLHTGQAFVSTHANE